MSIKHDIDGKESSKRHWAKVLIISGLIMAWISFIVWTIVVLWKYENGIEIPAELIYVQLLSGLGALGFTIGERWKKK